LWCHVWGVVYGNREKVFSSYVQVMEGNLNAYNCASEALARPVALVRSI
jgi:hypothetical protein